MTDQQSTYRVRFRRDVSNPTVLWCCVDSPRGVDCEVTWVGWSVCHPKDQFRKSTGRRVALTRAIKLLPREERRVIWQTWLAGRKGP